MAGAPRPGGVRHSGVLISELHRHGADGPDDTPPDPPPASRSDGPRVSFADGESRSWKDLELPPDATRDTGGPTDRPGGPDTGTGVPPGGPDADGPDVRPGGPDADAPGVRPERGGPGTGPDGPDGPGGGPVDDGEPDGPWRRTAPDSADGPYEPDAGPDAPGDEPHPADDADPRPPDGADPDRPPEPSGSPEPEAVDPADTADAVDAVDTADAAAGAAPVADAVRPSAPAGLGLPGAHGPGGVREAQPGPPERPGMPDVPAGPPPVPDLPPPPDVPEMPRFPVDQGLSGYPPPDATRPLPGDDPGTPPADAPPASRTPPPDRPAEHRDLPPDDRVARRVREAAEAQETDRESGAETGTDRTAPPPSAVLPCVPVPPAYVNYGRDGIARKDVYIDAAKRADEALRVGVPGGEHEADLVRTYAARLRERVAPAVREEVSALAAAASADTVNAADGTRGGHAVDGAGAVDVEVAGAEEIIDRVRAAGRAGHQVGDVTDAIRARVTVAGVADLPDLLKAAEKRFGTGDRGRVLEIRPNRTDVQLTIAAGDGGRRYAYELRLTVR